MNRKRYPRITGTRHSMMLMTHIPAEGYHLLDQSGPTTISMTCSVTDKALL